MNISRALIIGALSLSILFAGCAKGFKAIEDAANAQCNSSYQYDLDRSACYAGVQNFLTPSKLAELERMISSKDFNGTSYYVIRFQDLYDYTKHSAEVCDNSFKDNIAGLAACQKGVEVTADLFTEKRSTNDNSHYTVTLYDKDGARLIALDKRYVKNLRSGLAEQTRPREK